jgi:hypothetical protein
LCAEQDLNREIIRLNREIILPVKGHNREMTGVRAVSSRLGAIPPNPAARNVAAQPAETFSTAALFEV